MTRKSTLMSRVPPTRRNTRSWRTRRNFAWLLSDISLTSSRKSVPRSASSMSPFLPDLAFRPDLVEGASDGKLELFDVLEGLLEVVGRADLDGLHCALDLAEARDDDHGDLGVAGPERPEDVHAVHVREAEVEEDEVRAHLVGHLEPFLPRRGSMDLDLILAQDPGHQGPDVPLVVYHEDVIH